MGAKGGEEIKFSVDFDGNAGTESKEAALGVDQLRESIEASDAKIRDLNGSLRRMKGTTDEVKAAKAQLRAQITAEGLEMTKANMAIVKQGSSYDSLTSALKKAKQEEANRIASLKESAAAEKAAAKEREKEEKEAVASAKQALKELQAAEKEAVAKKEEAEKKKLDAAKKAADKVKASQLGLNKAIAAGGGPVASLNEKIQKMKEVCTGADGSISGLQIASYAGAAAIKAATVAAAAMAVALIAITTAAVAGTIALTKWIIASADLARSQQLVREASAYSTQSATNLGAQIDKLAMKVPVTTARLNEMASELQRARISGPAVVSLLNAMGQAEGAGLSTLTGKLKEVVTRGQMIGRMQLNPFEMMGSGLSFEEVAGQLAKQMHIGVDKARAELLTGVVKIDDGAKALEAAMAKRFGGINKRSMMSLSNVTETLSKQLPILTRGVSLEPLLTKASELLEVFDESSVTGQALKGIFTDLGNGAVKAMADAIPYIKSIFEQGIIGALKLEIAFLKAKITVRGWIDSVKESKVAMFFLNGGLEAAKLALKGVAWFLGLAAIAVGAFIAPWVIAGTLVIGAVSGIVGGVKWLYDKISEIDFAELGTQLIMGLVNGIKKALHFVTDSISSIASAIKKTFTGDMEIRSPSKVMDRFGEDTVKGTERGITRRKPNAQAAISDLINPGKIPGGLGFGGGPGGRQLVVNVYIAAPGSDAQSMTSPSFLGQLTKAVRDGVAGAGLGTT